MLSLFDDLHQILGIAAVLVAIAAGLVLGSRPYRLAAVVMMIETFGWLGFSWVLDQADKVVFNHGKSILVAALLALIVLRHRSFGLVVLLALQLVAVSIHLSIWIERSIPADVNALVLNGVGWGMVATLLVGSVGSFRLRRNRQTFMP